MSALQQGEADGLCGIYAVLNFLQTTDWEEGNPAKGLWYLLDACRYFGWFSPQQLTEGYEDYQMKAVLDLQFERYRLPYQTYFVRDVCKAHSIKSFYHLAVAVSAKQGSVIAAANRRNHWVLVHGGTGKPRVYDSAAKSVQVMDLLPNQRALSRDWGVIILPKAIEPVQVDL